MTNYRISGNDNSYIFCEEKSDSLPLNEDGLYAHNPCVFETHSGILFDFSNPKPEMINFNDMCRGLAREPRFKGHCDINYCVMQHELIVSYLVPQKEILVVQEGLFHDNEEYITGDWPKPLKNIPGMEVLIAKANEIRNMILNEYIFVGENIKKLPQEDVHPLVKKADKIAYLIERDWFKHKLKVISSAYEIPIYPCDFSFISLFSAIKDVLCFKGSEDKLIEMYVARCKQIGIDIDR